MNQNNLFQCTNSFGITKSKNSYPPPPFPSKLIIVIVRLTNNRIVHKLGFNVKSLNTNLYTKKNIKI